MHQTLCTRSNTSCSHVYIAGPGLSLLYVLSDRDTYFQTQNHTTSLYQGNHRNTDAKNILNKVSKGKCLLHLLEEAPRTAAMRGLPNIHKPRIPHRPITSCIGSALHKLLRCLARLLLSDLKGILPGEKFCDKRLVKFGCQIIIY